MSATHGTQINHFHFLGTFLWVEFMCTKDIQKLGDKTEEERMDGVRKNMGLG